LQKSALEAAKSEAGLKIFDRKPAHSGRGK